MKSLVTAATCLSLCFASACKQDDPPPELPPATSLSLDLAAMTAAPLAAKNAPTDPTAAPEDYLNFANAWLRVRIVEFYAGLVIVVPATAIALALTQDPTQSGNTWTWELTVGEATAELDVSIGLVTGFDVELYVSNAELERFLWVEGNFGDGTGTGEWVLHDPEIEGADKSALSITWSYVSDTDRSLSYEILSPRPNAQGEVVQGDTFTFAISGTTATLDYVDADDASSTAEISWSTEDGSGSITVPGFNNGATACWDDVFENVDC